MSQNDNMSEGQTEAPEPFPPELLTLPVEARLEYFEQRCLISHPRLQEALEVIIQAICPPGEGASIRRPGTMVLVIGPSRVGKTTLIRMLEERLLARCEALMVADPSFIPFASILATGPGTNHFDWAEYYRAILRALHDPFVDGKTARIRTRELREAMETALIQRKPLAIIADEAHHLAEAARGSRLQSQEEPHLVEQWEFLYARSIGCIGLLKMHLNRALNLALTEQARTVTLTHLRKTAPSETRIELALRNALESEAELTESDGADERLLTLLGLRGGRTAQQAKAETEELSPKPKKPDRPGKRSPGRDATGQEAGEDPSEPLSGEEKAG